jgi:hypothetical protein
MKPHLLGEDHIYKNPKRKNRVLFCNTIFASNFAPVVMQPVERIPLSADIGYVLPILTPRPQYSHMQHCACTSCSSGGMIDATLLDNAELFPIRARRATIVLDAEPLPGESGEAAAKPVYIELPSPSSKLLKGMKQLSSSAGDVAAEGALSAASAAAVPATGGAQGVGAVAVGSGTAKGGKKQVSDSC